MFIGIDVHVNHYTIAFIDVNGKLLRVEDTKSYDIIKEYFKESICWIGIDGPDGLNHGLMDDESYRFGLDNKLKGHYNKKVSEYLLTIKGIRPFSTPRSLDDLGGWKCWMTGSFGIFSTLRAEGFTSINETNINEVSKGMIEVFPHGSFTALLGQLPHKKSTEEGLCQRITVLSNYIKECEKFVKGSKKLRSDQLDAIVAAFTVYRLYKHEASLLGDIVEGQVALPVKTLKDKYRRGV